MTRKPKQNELPIAHKCAAEGCEVQVPLEALMCDADWRKVPASTQARVNEAFAKLKRAEYGIVPIYQSAVRAAVAAVKTVDSQQQMFPQGGVDGDRHPAGKDAPRRKEGAALLLPPT